MREGMAREEFLTTRETAELLKLSPGTLKTWRWGGKGPDYIKAGEAVRYRRSDVMSWMRANTTTHDVGVSASGDERSWVEVATSYLELAGSVEGEARRCALAQAREAIERAEEVAR